MAIVKKGSTYVVQYGNRRLSKLKPDYLEHDTENSSVSFEVDGIVSNYNFGSIIDVKKSFMVHEHNGFRVNIIGYTNRSKIETGVLVEKKDIMQRYSVDKNGKIFRIEFYKKKKFAGMILVKFES